MYIHSTYVETQKASLQILLRERRDSERNTPYGTHMLLIIYRKFRINKGEGKENKRNKFLSTNFKNNISFKCQPVQSAQPGPRKFLDSLRRNH